MHNVKILPDIESWDCDNEYYYYEYFFEGEDGMCDSETIKVPIPMPEFRAYRRRKIPSDMLNLPQYNNCKDCDKILFDGYWRRMHRCRECYEKWQEERKKRNRLF